MIVFILGGALMLGVCIFIHELGHYLLGLAVGVKARIFSIGYGRGIWKKQIGDTTWQITAIPLGGYVMFYGNDFMDEDSRRTPGGFYSVGPLKRMIPVLGGPLFNLILGLIIFLFLHMLSGPLAPRVQIDPGMQDHSPAYQAGLRTGDEIQSVDGQPIESFHDVWQITALSEGRPLEIVVDRGGALQSFTVRPEVSSSGTSQIGIRMPGEMRLAVNYPNFTVWKYRFLSIFGEVELPRQIRALPYLHDGDVILEVEGQSVAGVAELQRILGENHGETVRVRVERESLPWLAPWFTHETTVEVPSSKEYIVHLRNVVDQKYGAELPDRALYSMAPEHQEGLTFLRINGAPPKSFPNMAERFPQPESAQISVGGREYSAQIDVQKTGMLGFQPMPMVRGDYRDQHASAGAAIEAALGDTWKNVMIYPAFFQSLFAGRVSLIDNAAGPVRIFGAAGMLAKQDYQHYLTLFAAISIALFVMNLLPFPVVDGGHIVLFAFEAIAGRPLSPAVIESIYKFGFTVILLFGLWIMYRDVLWFAGL